MTTTTSATPDFFRGEWLEPGQPAYDEALPVFNRRAQVRPAVIARCNGAADVVAALAFARERSLTVGVRATGYTFNLPVKDTGLVIDLSLMRGIQILPEQRVARIQGGIRGGDLQVEAAVHGLAGATGALSGTGVGLMLSGGVGHLSPRIGFASDNILSVELVTAAGEVVTASPTENPDLFWAVRGSSGSFGVVTALEVRLHDVPPFVRGGMMSWRLDNITGVVEALRSLWDWAPEQLAVIGILSSASFDGQGGLDLFVCHSGSEDQALADLDRLRSFGKPDAEEISTMPFRDLHFAFDEAFPPMRGTINEQAVTDFSDELVAALVADIGLPAKEGARFVEIVLRRGAMAGTPELPSALRETPEEPTWSLGPGCWWEDEAEDDLHDRWVELVMADIRRVGRTVDRAHPNSVGVALDEDEVAAMYGDRFERLRSLKRQWDPDNVFRGSHNIRPAEG